MQFSQTDQPEIETLVVKTATVAVEERLEVVAVFMIMEVMAIMLQMVEERDFYNQVLAAKGT